MKYMGSKSRHAKHILPYILKYHTEDMWYVEPFVGGANVIDKVPFKRRIGFDINEDLICVLDAASSGWLPRDDYTEQEYKELKSDNTPSPDKGYAAFALSYGGKYFGGWCRDGQGKRNYVQESYNNAIKQFPLLKDVIFKQKSYKDIVLPNIATIYCDPPYAGTTSYRDSFDHEVFWQWCRDKVAEGHNVYVSEYNAPEDFIAIWGKETTSSLTKDTGSKRATEKLFIHKSQYKEEK